MFLLVSILVPLTVYYALNRMLGRDSNSQWLLIIACALFFVSFWLPSPMIYGQNTQFTTHFVGGGLFSGLIWLYVAKAQKWLPKPWYVEAASLFALVCTLGVSNELFELGLFVAGYMPHGIADTSWDLAANTLGALMFYLSYKVFYTKR